MLSSYGVEHSNPSAHSMDIHIEEFRNLGYTIIEDVLTFSECEALKRDLHAIYAIQEEAFGKSELDMIGEQNIVRAPLCYMNSYLQLARTPSMMEYVQRILGNYYILHLQNGIINTPTEKHHQTAWHRDFPYQNWTSSSPLGCNVYYCLDDFHSTNGSTYVLPFSHKIDMLPTPEFVNKHKVQIKARLGSVILFDPMVFHCAGENKSTSNRIGINHVYTRGIIRQQISLPNMLKGNYSEDAFLRMLLGYDAETSLDVEDFRRRRLTKKNT